MSETRETKRRVAVMLDTSVFARLWAEAQAEGVSVAEVVRRIIDERIRGECAQPFAPPSLNLGLQGCSWLKARRAPFALPG